MAQAPRPGVSKRDAAATAAKSVMTISIKGQSATLAIGSVPISERLIVRKATGLPFEAFVGDGDRMGVDSLVVLWWLARRANGEPMLTFTQVSDEWPDELDGDDIEVTVDTPDEEADDPEA